MGIRNQYELRKAPLLHFRDEFLRLADKKELGWVVSGTLAEPSIIADRRLKYKYDHVFFEIFENQCSWLFSRLSEFIEQQRLTQEDAMSFYKHFLLDESFFFRCDPNFDYENEPCSCMRHIFEKRLSLFEVHAFFSESEIMRRRFFLHDLKKYEGLEWIGERSYSDGIKWRTDSMTMIPYGDPDTVIAFTRLIRQVQKALNCSWVDKVFQLAYERRPGYSLRAWRHCDADAGLHAASVGKHVITSEIDLSTLEEYLCKTEPQGWFPDDDMCNAPVFWFSYIENIIQSSAIAMRILCDDIDDGIPFENHSPRKGRFHEYEHRDSYYSFTDSHPIRRWHTVEEIADCFCAKYVRDIEKRKNWKEERDQSSFDDVINDDFSSPEGEVIYVYDWSDFILSVGSYASNDEQENGQEINTQTLDKPVIVEANTKELVLQKIDEMKLDPDERKIIFAIQESEWQRLTTSQLIEETELNETALKRAVKRLREKNIVGNGHGTGKSGYFLKSCSAWTFPK